MSPLPSFSIVVPTRNRPRQLGELLEACVRLEIPVGGFEVVVVDDGGRAPLDPIIDAFGEKLALTHFRVAHCGPAAARQVGVERARGRFLAFTDDDCLPDPDWLIAAGNRIDANPVAAVGGRVMNALEENPFSSATQILLDALYEENGGPRFFTTNNVAFSAEAFRAVGGLDSSWEIPGGEDRDLARRWMGHGFPLLFAPEMRVRHSHRLTFAGFWKQHFHYGRGAFRFHCASPGGESLSRRFEPMRFYFGLPTRPFGRTPHPWKVAGALLLSQVATVVGFARQAVAELLTSRREGG